MSLLIPPAPHLLQLPITTSWDGTPCRDRQLHGLVTLWSEAAGVWVSATLPQQQPPCIPPVPPYTRVANLWEYDVVECFLAGEDGYLEVELGAGGHFLVLAFTAPRRLANAYEHFIPRMTYQAAGQDNLSWMASLMLPWRMLPRNVQRGNAYVSSRGQYLCYQPLPGTRADFHQPERFPMVRLAD